MLARFRPRLTLANVISVIALFVALGGGALAATSFVGTDGRIHGCVGKKGQLNVLRPGKHCKKGTAIAWNQRGPRGAPGVIAPAKFNLVGPATTNCDSERGHFCRLGTTLWQTPSNDSAPLGYARDAAGFVRLSGSAEAVSGYVCPIFFLPAGMRPAGQRYEFPVVVRRGLDELSTIVYVDTDGGVSCPRTTSSTNGDVVDLSTVAFRPGG